MLKVIARITGGPVMIPSQVRRGENQADPTPPKRCPVTERLPNRAFTLIELLIVVAIIAILAAIAVPNFLEAQTRAKVSRAKNDMRTLATGLESYYVDNNDYPPCSTFGIPGYGVQLNTKPVLERISTPISYVTSGILPNPFRATRRASAATAAATAVNEASGTAASLNAAELANPAYQSFLYQSGNDYGRCAYSGAAGGAPSFPAESTKSSVWILHSPGPRNHYYNLGGVLSSSSLISQGTITNAPAGSPLSDCLSLIYDPTNGTVSGGAIWRVGGQVSGNYFNQMSRAISSQR